MKQKLQILLGLTFVFLLSCKKDGTDANSNSATNGNSLATVNYLRVDTTTVHLTSLTRQTGRISALKTASSTASVSTYLNENYAGNNVYQLSPGVIPANASGTQIATFILYKDGAIYESEGTITGFTITVTKNLPAGIYYFQINIITGGASYSVTTPSFTIVTPPTPPAGMIALYEYFNGVGEQHICTSNWEELGSGSQNFVFSRVLGYMYPSATSITGLKPIYRYYKSSTGSHYTTDQYSTFTNYTYEKVLGYVSTSATTAMPNGLTKWYSSAADDHYVCIPPVVPIASSLNYTQDVVDFTFGYVQ